MTEENEVSGACPTGTAAFVPSGSSPVPGLAANAHQSTGEPPFDTWVLAYWPHMDRSFTQGPRRGGWHPSRLRVKRGDRHTSWQMRTGYGPCYPQGEPLFWTPIEEPL